MTSEIATPILIILLGAIGGFARVIFTGLRKPHWLRPKNRKQNLFDFGSPGDIALGALSSYLFWTTGWGSHEPPVVYGLALACGILSSSIVGAYVDSRNNKYISNVLSDAIEKKLKNKRN